MNTKIKRTDLGDEAFEELLRLLGATIEEIESCNEVVLHLYKKNSYSLLCKK